MNASELDAIAEVGGLIVVLGGVLGTIALALLQRRFVTRNEHHVAQEGLSARINGVEAGLAEKVGKKDLDAFNGRLHACEQGLSTTNVKLAETNGLLKSNTDAARSLERQINLLMQNELAKEKS